MPNSLLTPQAMASAAIQTLYNQTILLPLVSRDYEETFANVGDTITVRKRPTFVSQEFNPVSGVVIQDIVETSTTVKMDKHYDISIAVTSKELTLSIRDFQSRVLMPVMEAHAQMIDQQLFSLVKDIPYTSGTAGTPPTSVAYLTNARMILNLNNAPVSNRIAILDPTAENALLNLEAFTNASWNQESNGNALDEASLGRKFGFDMYSSLNTPTVSNGTIASTGSFTLTGGGTLGSTSITVGGTTLTGTWNKGSIFTITGVTGNFVVANDAIASGNAATVTFYPPLPQAVTNGTVIVRVAGHVSGVAFHPTAFNFVSRPLALPLGAANAQIVNYKGLGLRVVYAYDAVKKVDMLSIDLLFGLKTMDPKMAVRLLA
jgi:hypothetical protein